MYPRKITFYLKLNQTLDTWWFWVHFENQPFPKITLVLGKIYHLSIYPREDNCQNLFKHTKKNYCWRRGLKFVLQNRKKYSLQPLLVDNM